MRESVQAVQAEIMMSFLVSEELSFRIPVELRYESTDPYAVRLTFHLPGDAPVTWAFGRELLVDGVNGAAGDGDVRVSPVERADGGGAGEMPGEVHIRLQVGSDQALFRAGVAPLIAFLDRTDKLVPLGQEQALADFEADLDEALDRILAEEQSAG
ncbi:SsgA family sporulation/cell division regulator [Streptomyces sp. SID8379]|uniref:SsgA family sporulation/cell division regulator n=1 Tax=unclassified Streptomyces TaxID=2593676 RepID=UPI0003AB36BC|nr:MULTISPECIES: SsgA family sporulation/cell division regulator [unclassified Streptomyces]MYW63952.1 SsgA family sporulation/cell division regulator [Streptomyces sp. SID8379]